MICTRFSGHRFRIDQLGHRHGCFSECRGSHPFRFCLDSPVVVIINVFSNRPELIPSFIAVVSIEAPASVLTTSSYFSSAVHTLFLVLLLQCFRAARFFYFEPPANWFMKFLFAYWVFRSRLRTSTAQIDHPFRRNWAPRPPSLSANTIFLLKTR